MCELLYLRGGGQVQVGGHFLKNAKKSVRSGQKCSKPGGIRFLGSKWTYFLVWCLFWPPGDKVRFFGHFTPLRYPLGGGGGREKQRGTE